MKERLHFKDLQRWLTVAALGVVMGLAVDQTQAQDEVVSLVIAYEVFYEPWQQSFPFLLNPESCEIENGAVILATEMNRFAHWNPSLGEAADYFAIGNGGTEEFRHYVEALFLEAGCDDVSYLVGTRVMDTSGLGNVMYGFYLSGVPFFVEDLIARAVQGFEDDTHDVSQRLMGRYVGELTKNDVTAENVADAAERAALT